MKISCFLFLHFFVFYPFLVSASFSDNVATVGEVNLTASPPTALDDSTPSKVTLPLAKNRTQRPDILKGFKKYRSGLDLANRHYWSSVGFTGVAGFILAALWFISFGLLLAAYHCCGRRITKKDLSSNHANIIRLLLLIVFTCTSVIGGVLLVIGQDEFQHKASHALRYIINQSNNTVQMIRDVDEYVLAAKNITVKKFFFPPSVFIEMGPWNMDLHSAANTLAEKTTENTRKLRDIIQHIQSVLMVVVTMALLIALLGLLLSIFGHCYAINIFIFSGWLLVAINFVLFGVFLIATNAISDTCIAMEEWANNSLPETSLSNILTCVNQKTANQTLIRSVLIVNALVDVVNMAIDVGANINPSHKSVFYQNQSGPFMPHLCSPFDSDLNDTPCGSKYVSLANASSVWQNYTCKASANGLCTTVGRITPDMYGQLAYAVNVSYGLYHYAPPLLGLQDCSFVREAFKTIASSYCPQLKYYLHIVVVGLGLISLGIMLSLILWFVYISSCQREVLGVQPPGKHHKPFSLLALSI